MTWRAAIVTCALGCVPGRDPVERSTVLFSDARARIEVDESTDDAFPDPVVRYRLRLFRGGRDDVPLAGWLQAKSFHPAATRLPGGSLAFVGGRLACAIGERDTLCVDLGDVACGGAAATFCPRDPIAGTQCTSALLAHAHALDAALLWIAADARRDASEQVAALVALARNGAPPTAIVAAIQADGRPDQVGVYLDGAAARAFGDASRIASLRDRLGASSHCDDVAIAWSCVPELTGDVTRLRRAMTRREWAADLEAAERACATLPVPRRR